MTEVLVTGASGAIGTALLKRLESTEFSVVGVDREPNRRDTDAQILQRDLSSAEDLPDADVLVHLAAHSQVQPILEDPSLAVENVRTTERVLEHAKRVNANVILASSREVYGSAIAPREGDVTVDATNPYGASKIGSEAFASAFSSCFSVDVTTLRFSNVYGPFDRNARVIPVFISLGLQGKELAVYGDSKVLDFVYVDDVVDAIVRTIRRRAGLAGEAITIGSGRGTQLSDLAERIAESIDACPGYTIEPNRTGDTEKFVARIEKARALLDFEPTPLATGLPKTIDWYREHDRVLESIREEFESSD